MMCVTCCRPEGAVRTGGPAHVAGASGARARGDSLPLQTRPPGAGARKAADVGGPVRAATLRRPAHARGHQPSEVPRPRAQGHRVEHLRRRAGRVRRHLRRPVLGHLRQGVSSTTHTQLKNKCKVRKSLRDVNGINSVISS